MAKKHKGRYTFGTCDLCGITTMPLNLHNKNEWYCDPCLLKVIKVIPETLKRLKRIAKDKENFDYYTSLSK